MRRRVLLPALAIVLVCSGAFVAYRSAHTSRKTALIYGDSLVWESMWATKQAFASEHAWTAIYRVFPTEAPCNWVGTLRADIERTHPASITLATAGSNYPSCMDHLALGSAAYYAKYRTDLNRFFSTAARSHVHVVFFVDPPIAFALANQAITHIAALATQLAHQYRNVSIVTTGRDQLSDHGSYVSHKPCLENETPSMGCAHGQIAIRTTSGSQAGIHFCPPGLPTKYPGFCRVYSSGEYRFGTALARAAAA